MATCNRCKRPLSNTASVQHGMGPVCYAKYAAVLAAAARGGCRSRFDVVKVEPGMVWIVDRDQGMSVTNDADAVCAALAVEHGNARIIYRDTMGRWDELVHDHGKFQRYAPAASLGLEVLS